MEENNTADEKPPWASLCNVNVLAFRSACNAVVEAAKRPIKRRVIERLAESAEAQQIFGLAWMPALGSMLPSPENFYEQLSKSQLWSTLVVETIAAERKWGDIFSATGFLGSLDRVHALWEKCFGKDASSLTKVASTAIAGTGSLILAIQINPNILHSVTLPIEVELKKDSSPLPVSFLIDSEGSAIPISIKGPNGTATIPVSFEPSINDKPLKLHFESDGKDDKTPAAALNLAASQLEKTNTSIAATATQLTNLVNLTSNRNADGLLNRLSDVNTGVGELTRAFNDAVVAVAIMTKEQGNAVTAKLDRVAETAVMPHQQIMTTLRANTARSIVLPSVEPKGGTTTFVKVTLCTGAIKTTHKEMRVELGIATAFDNRPCSHRDWKSAGAEVASKDGHWIATVNSFDRNWYGSRSATITLSPARLSESIVAVAQQGLSD